MSAALNKLFTDKRQCAALVALWCMAIVASLASTAAVTKSSFWAVGPNKGTSLLGVPLDTWESWGSVAALAFVGTLMHEFIIDSLGPWVQNSVQDHKSHDLPYNSRLVCHLILQVYTAYTHLATFAFLVLYTTQVDILLIRMVADLMVTAFSTHIFLADKEASKPPPIDVALVLEEDLRRPPPPSHASPPLSKNHRTTSGRSLRKVQTPASAYSWDSFAATRDSTPSPPMQPQLQHQEEGQQAAGSMMA